MVFSIFFLWWLLLSHVTFFTEEKFTINNDFCKIKIYQVMPFNLIGLYSSMMVGDIPVYAVLFDKNGQYIGQSSPFKIIGLYVLVNTNLQNDCNNLQKSFFSLVDEYNISSNHKKWWDFILFYFH